MGNGFSPYGREGPLDFCPFEIPFWHQQNRIRKLMLKGFEPREATQGVLKGGSVVPETGSNTADGPSTSVRITHLLEHSTSNQISSRTGLAIKSWESRWIKALATFPTDTDSRLSSIKTDMSQSRLRVAVIKSSDYNSVVVDLAHGYESNGNPSYDALETPHGPATTSIECTA